MHTFSESGTGVPAFLAKLWRLVEDPKTNNLISWSKDGQSFIIQNQAQFARELLPMNYKHNNMASFIRQLNMYGFHKITSLDNGGLKFDRDEMEFSHPCFKRGHPFLLEHIKRKIATTKSSMDEKGLIKPEAVGKVLSEVKAMRGRQDSLDSRFSVMKQENEALWREIASLRQKHMKQQQIVNKLIQFLVTIVQPQTRKMGGVKRQYPLMINDVPQSKTKKENEDDSGPIIHELTEELLDEVADADDELLISSPNVLSPGGGGSSNGGGGGGGGSLDILCAPSPDGASSISSGDRPTSNPSTSSSMSSHIYDQHLSNQSIDDESNPSMPITTHKIVGPDDVVYHVSEATDNMDATDFIEENVLNTPLVKEEMARLQREQRMRLLKRQQRERKHLLMQQSAANSSSGQKKKSAATSTTSVCSSNDGGNISFELSDLHNMNDITTPLQIKTEKDIDHMLFLNCSDDVTLAHASPIDSSMVSPISVGGAAQDPAASLTAAVSAAIPQDDGGVTTSSGDEYITGDMPTDIFEDSPMLGDINLSSGSFNQNINLKGNSVCGSSKSAGVQNIITSDNMKGSSSKNKTATATSATQIASTSTAATSSTPSNDNIVVAGPSDSKMNQDQNMTLAKYNTNKYISNEDIMRLSTAEDFTNHLDNMQEDLDTLKDVLRGEGYSFDANTLLSNATPANRFTMDGEFFQKLFSDSDVLAPYGLSISNDADKKGLELMSYQPYYADLSDILDINPDPTVQKSSEGYDEVTAKTPMSSNSVLNTPYHE